MSCQFTATVDYLEKLSAAPQGVELLHDSDLPADVTEELNSAGVGIGGFLQLIPLLLQLFQNPQLRELIAAILAALKPQS